MPATGWVLPDVSRSRLVIAAPGDGPGNWAGGPSAALAEDGTIYLAYRMRRPVGAGRGYANVVARSPDGERFDTVAVLDRDAFGAESLERPALVALPRGGWRVYVSCATPGSLHWRVDVVEADEPAGLGAAVTGRRTVFFGDEQTAVKDPVVVSHGGRWHCWLCSHPLGVDAEADRMATRYASSPDGINWEVGEIVLAGRPNAWDTRGARVATVLLDGERPVAYYDGRASANPNLRLRIPGILASSWRFGPLA